jgi:hypothetical protein
MAEIEISVNNLNSTDRKFYLFSTPPVVSGSGPNIFANIYLATGLVAGSTGTGKITVTTDKLYAICGKQSLAVGSTVLTSDKHVVTLGDSGAQNGTGVTIKNNEHVPHFDKPKTKKNAPPGNYQVITGSDFTAQDNFFTGLGGTNQDGQVIPVSTFKADPSITYSIAPVKMYYICTGSYKTGQIINVKEVGETVTIDFTTGYTSAITEYQLDGTFSPPRYT